MSIAAVDWALRRVPATVPPAQRLVLIHLAERAGGYEDDFSATWPSARTIAERCGVSIRTVRRHLHDLEEAGYIRRGDQSHVAHWPADRRPVVWNLVPEAADRAGCQNVTPDNPERGDAGVTTGVTLVTERGDAGVTQTIHNHPSNRPTPCSPPAGDESETAPSAEVALRDEKPAAKTKSKCRSAKHDAADCDDFMAWYSLYPRKAKRPDAHRAWHKAVKKAGGHEALMGLTAERVEELRSRGTYCPYPASWLNGEGYLEPVTQPMLERKQPGGLEWSDLLSAMDDADQTEQPDQQALDGGWLDAEIVDDDDDDF